MDEPRVKRVKKPRKDSAPENNTGTKGKDKEEHPIAALAGIFKDDPLWDEFIEAMRRAREEEEARP